MYIWACENEVRLEDRKGEYLLYAGLNHGKSKIWAVKGKIPG